MRAFTMIELVIVLAIVAILAAIAVMRLGGQATRAADAVDDSDAAALQRALEHYRAEHGVYPTAAAMPAQLTQYTDGSGDVSPTRTPQHQFGPYARTAPVVGPAVATGVTVVFKNKVNGAKWVYVEASGSIKPYDWKTNTIGD